jgi:hypothetical protein
MPEWKNKLGGFFREVHKSKQDQDGTEVARFIAEVVVPAFEELKPEMEKHGRTATVRNAVSSAAISVHHNGEEELSYRLQCRIFPTRILPYVDIRFRERKGLRLIRTEVMLREGGVEYSLSDVTKEEIIEHFVDNYTRRVQVD